jgi:hypothetical protein
MLPSHADASHIQNFTVFKSVVPGIRHSLQRLATYLLSKSFNYNSLQKQSGKPANSSAKLQDRTSNVCRVNLSRVNFSDVAKSRYRSYNYPPPPQLSRHPPSCLNITIVHIREDGNLVCIHFEAFR